LLMKQQLVIIHTIHQNENPAQLDSWVTNTLSGKICPEKIACSCIIVKHNALNCCSVEDLRSLSPVEVCISVGYDRLLFW